MNSVLIIAFKIVLVSGWASLGIWVGYYSRHAKWWKDPIGKSIVYHALLVGALLLVSTMSLFFHFNRLDSVVAAWIDVGLIGLVTPVMLWRTWIFRQVARRPAVPHCPTCTCGGDLPGCRCSCTSTGSPRRWLSSLQWLHVLAGYQLPLGSPVYPARAPTLTGCA